MPPADGYLFDTLMYEYALNPQMMAAIRKASGNSAPASSATCPVSAKMPAPIITPVPIATAPGRVRLFFSYEAPMQAQCTQARGVPRAISALETPA